MPGPNFFNSKEYEWNDVRANISGANVTKLRGVQYKEMMDKELLYAAGGKPIGIQQGNTGYEGTLTLLRGALDDLNDAAVDAGGKNCLDLEFDIVVKFLASADGTRALRTNTLVRVQIKEYETAFKQNDKQQEVALPIIFLDLLNN